MTRSVTALLIAGTALALAPEVGSAQQPVALSTRASAGVDTTRQVVARPDEVPVLHHTHLNSIDPNAAIAWYEDVWPQGRSGEVSGFPAFLAEVPVLFDRVDQAPEGAWDFERHRAFPQSAFWHIGAFANTTARFEALEARGHTVLRLARDASDTVGVMRSGLAGETPRDGGFGYLVGPDGALVEITGGPGRDPAFAHVHLFGEQPRCSANWYAEMLGFALPAGRDPDTGNPVPRERYEPCEGERAEPTFPSLDPAGTIRGPTATIRHGSGTISIYPRQCLGDQCEIDEPLVPSRGQVLDHVAFEVADLPAWIEWLESREVTFLERYRPFAPEGSLDLDAPGSVIVEGPDGLAIELVGRRSYDGRIRTLQRDTRDRWIHEGAWAPAIGPTTSTEAWQIFHLGRAFITRDPQRTLHLRARADKSAQITTYAATNTPSRLWVGQPALSWNDGSIYASSESERRGDRLRAVTGLRPEILATASARLWEITVPWRPGAVEGDVYVDSLSFSTMPVDGVAESLSGVWRHEVLGDTLIDGSSYPLLRYTAEVEYEGDFEEEASLRNGWERYVYDLEGSISGVLALDTLLGVRRAGSDTMRLAGTSSLSIDTGESFASNVDYERLQRWALSDSVEWQARRDSLRAIQSDARGGMVRVVPPPPDTSRARFDSLVAVWRTGEKDEVRRPAEIEIAWILREAPAYRPEFDSARREVGDTARLIWDRLIELRRDEDPLTPERVEENAPWLLDPERVWALGENVWVMYGTYRNVLSSSHPRFASGTPNGCTPEGCRALVELAEGSGVPWLEDLALLDRFWGDPVGHWEELSAAARERGSPLVVREWLGVQGVNGRRGLEFSESDLEERRFPELDDWRAWLERGRLPRPGAGGGKLEVWAEIEGVDLESEFTRALERAESDSARVVFEAWLAALGEPVELPTDSLVKLVALDDELRRQDAVQRLVRRVGPELTADSVRARELLPRLVEAILEEEPAAFADIRGGAVHPGRQGYHGIRDVPLIVDADSLDAIAPGVRWAEFVGDRAVLRANIPDWEPRDGGVVLRFAPVQAFGDFALVSFSWTSWDEREEDQVERGYAGGQSLWLIRTEEGWRVFAASAWIT